MTGAPRVMKRDRRGRLRRSGRFNHCVSVHGEYAESRSVLLSRPPRQKDDDADVGGGLYRISSVLANIAMKTCAQCRINTAKTAF